MNHPSSARARMFRQLHAGPDILILANAWDAGSARLIESLGARAVATTSAGVAWSNGYPDGDALPVSLLAATIASIARVIGVPLSADIEGGYSSDPASIGETVTRVIDAGAVGINIEDGAGTPDLLCAKIEQTKCAATRSGIDLFVNARTDVYLRGLATGQVALDETIARAGRYRNAGADSIFVPGVVEAGDIRDIVKGVSLPLNVLSWPGLPAYDELRALGVRRLSAGAAVAAAAWNQARSSATAFLAQGSSESRSDGGTMSTRDINALLRGK